MIQKYHTHSIKVDDWIKTATPGLTAMELSQLFELAINRIWARCYYPIGEVTLMAVLDRALFNSASQHPLLLPLTIDSSGVQWGEFRKSCTKLNPKDVIAAFAYFITEFIVIASSITGEFLASPLHKELANVTLNKKINREEL